MKDILFDDINKNSEISDFYAVETSYDYFEIHCKIDGVEYRVLDTRRSRCSDMVFTDTSHQINHTEYLLKELGFTGNLDKVLHYTFNHNPSTWEEDYEDDEGFDGWYGDGLDHIEELYYID